MKKYSHLIFFIVLTLAIAAAIFGVIFFAGKIKVALDKQERIKLEHQIQQEQIENLPELAKTYQNVLSKERLFSFLYSEDRLVEIIKEIERLAKEESVTLTITQKEVIKKKVAQKEEDSSEEKKEEAEAQKTLEDSLPYEKNIRLELKADGQYLAIRNFLYKLESAPFALDVLSLNASLAAVDDDGSVRSVTPADSPFLLGGNAVPEEQSQSAQPDKVTAVIETALYVK